MTPVTPSADSRAIWGSVSPNPYGLEPNRVLRPSFLASRKMVETPVVVTLM